ncbi:Hypothetical predicted protein [Paramuricea clavata]|nr:Hypothetical predicted protein [Paramuricea clavata]
MEAVETKFPRLEEAPSKIKVNGECENTTNNDKNLPSEQMTSADYYFDSYAHFVMRDIIK